MIKESEFDEEYKIVMPIPQAYSKMPCTKKAERDWWKDYYSRNPTLLMRIAKKFHHFHLAN